MFVPDPGQAAWECRRFAATLCSMLADCENIAEEPSDCRAAVEDRMDCDLTRMVSDNYNRCVSTLDEGCYEELPPVCDGVLLY